MYSDHEQSSPLRAAGMLWSPKPAYSTRAITIVACISALLGVVISQLFMNTGSPDSQLFNARIPLDVLETVFTYNKTFGANPFESASTQEAWDSIVPAGQGTVQFPPRSKQFATLSAVHQLHCLWSIHQTLYSMLPSDQEGENAEHIKSVADQSLPHIRHCFDYLRQTLMCAADTTLEPIDTKLGGVTGWGTSKTCRNYAELMSWAEEHRANNLHGFRQGHHDH